MRRVDVHLVRAFGEEPGGGNPAGVVLDASGIPSADRQRIAAEVGYSETAFIERQGPDAFRLSFFTPAREIANCGHATVASFFLLKREGLVAGSRARSLNRTGANEIRFADGLVFMAQPRASYEEVGPDREAALESLGAAAADVERLWIGSTGNRFLIAALRSAEALARLAPRQELVRSLSEKRALVGVYAFALKAGSAEAATTRMFAPLYGIPEESATGMAAGPLAWALRERYGVAGDFVLEQGALMKPAAPSRLHARFSGDLVEIGGKAILAETRALSLP